MILALILIQSCAKETSRADKDRENTDREVARLSTAAGIYYGSVNYDEQRKIPAKLDLTIKRNPTTTDERPTLQAALSVGFFGGVTVSSDSTSYDWETGKLTASFSRKDGSPVEMIAYVREGKITNGALIGPNMGRREFTMDSRFTKLFDGQESEEANLAVTFGNAGRVSGSSFDALLTLRRKSETIAGPANSDLPNLPAISASFKFNRVGHNPQVASQVIYDPLKGVMDIFLSSNDRVRISNIFVREETGLLGVALQGEVLRGADVIDSARLKVISMDEVTSSGIMDSEPPRNFTGTFKGESDANEYPVFATFEYQGNDGQNPAGLTFSTFPIFRLLVIACIEGKPFASVKLLMSSLNHVERKAQLRNELGARPRELTLDFAPDWTSVVGKFRTVGTTGGDVKTGEAYLKLKATGTQDATGCPKN